MGLAWVDSSIVPVIPISGDLPVERAVVIAVGLACLILGAIAAWIQDDLEHVVGYATVQDAGVVILAFAALDPGVWPASRTWIIVLLAARTAFAAWAVVVRARYGTRHIDDLDGWARRSPVLGISLLAIAIASVGWPGLAAFDARADVIQLAIDGPIQALALAAVFLPLLYYGRLFVVGLARPGEAMLAVQDDRPRRPTAQSPGPGTSSPRRPGRAILSTIRPAVDTNRPLLIATLALVLAGTAVITAAGGFGLPAAAAESAPGSAEEPRDVTGPGTGPSSSPSLSPEATPSPTPASTTAPSATASPGPTVTASAPVSPTPSGSPAPSASPSATPATPAATPAGS